MNHRDYMPPDSRPKPLAVGDKVWLNKRGREMRVPEMSVWVGFIKSIDHGRALVQWPDNLEKEEPRYWNERLDHLDRVSYGKRN